jgi:hypothetical protein
VRELLGREVRDRLAGDVGNRHPERQRVDERPHDDVAALLRPARVHVVDVQRVVVHRDQAEEVVVGLGDRLRRPVLVDGALLELLEVAPVGMGAGRFTLSLVRGEVVAHGPALCRSGLQQVLLAERPHEGVDVVPRRLGVDLELADDRRDEGVAVGAFGEQRPEHRTGAVHGQVLRGADVERDDLALDLPPLDGVGSELQSAQTGGPPRSGFPGLTGSSAS